jgi:hypothetical protein
MSPLSRALGLWLLAGALAGLAWMLPPLAQPSGYHDFADQREAWPYGLFFFAMILVGPGSGYYHLAPNNARLLGDRLAMMLAFMAWFAAIVGERVGPQAGLRLLPLVVAAGLGSVIWWGWSEARGMGDLRPYFLMQLYPVLLIPLLLRLYPPRYSGGRTILAVIGLYLLALFFDLGDRPVFALTGGFVSGHTLKHGIAALAVVAVLLHLLRRCIDDGAMKQA